MAKQTSERGRGWGDIEKEREIMRATSLREKNTGGERERGVRNTGRDKEGEREREDKGRELGRWRGRLGTRGDRESETGRHGDTLRHGER